jgi:hypothetical protein
MIQEELYREAKRKTPKVVFRGDRFIIEGRSIPENPRDFYLPLYDWILEKSESAGELMMLEFAFDYLNSASAKWIFLILRDLTVKGKKFRVIWSYEKGDDDMRGLAVMYQSLLSFPLTTIEVASIPGANAIK